LSEVKGSPLNTTDVQQRVVHTTHRHRQVPDRCKRTPLTEHRHTLVLKTMLL
jgi:hypothetical protein